MVWIPSEATRRLWSEQRRGNSWNKGRKHTEEAKRNMTASRVARGLLPPVRTTCTQCGESFDKFRCHVRRIKDNFCSKECYDAFQRRNRITKQCTVCGDYFQVRPCEECKFSTCNKPECRRGRKRADRNPNWRGGVTKPRKADLTTKEYREWRKAVFERDDYTCQREECEAHGGELHAHHIKPWAWFPELRYEVGNGVTLCKLCHEKTYGDTFKQRPSNAECVAAA